MSDCIVCGNKQAKIIDTLDLNRITIVTCPRCGMYGYTKVIANTIKALNEKYKLSGWIRQFKEKAIENGATDKKDETYLDYPELNSRNIDETLRNLPDLTFKDKQVKILEAIRRRTDALGDYVLFRYDDNYSISFSKTAMEFATLLENLRENGLIKDSSGLGYFEGYLTLTAFDYLEDLAEQTQILNHVFVAMSFNEAMNNAYDNGIKPAIEMAGYIPIRLDRTQHNDKIDDRIITEIRRSKFIISDATNQSNGVYFEAGFAMGLDRPVIWSVAEKDKENLHFDTRQFNHIVWENELDLREKLYYRIMATIGPGPSAPAELPADFIKD